MISREQHIRTDAKRGEQERGLTDYFTAGPMRARSRGTLRTTWVKMASLFWMLLIVPENSRISVDSSTMSAGCNLQSITSCELSTLEERWVELRPQARWPSPHHQTKEVVAVPSHWHSCCTLRMPPARLKMQSLFCTLQKCVTAGTGPHK